LDAQDSHSETIREEFTRQSAGFNSAPVMNGKRALGALVEAIPAGPGERWLETSCGPGIVSRSLAPRVGEMVGVDLTPAMIELARSEAAAAGADNLTFEIGDATALDLPADSFDGAVNRFSLHHIPVLERVVAEMARVVRPGGAVVIADAISDTDHETAAWREEIERLRDPSHWAFPSVERLRAAGEGAGLELESDQLVGLHIPLADWIERGRVDANGRALIERLAGEVPASGTRTHIHDVNGTLQIDFTYWLSVWRAR
jgi:ubiquinone/menaquinone biosynthesis C-methylase UbiE